MEVDKALASYVEKEDTVLLQVISVYQAGSIQSIGESVVRFLFQCLLHPGQRDCLPLSCYSIHKSCEAVKGSNSTFTPTIHICIAAYSLFISIQFERLCPFVRGPTSTRRWEETPGICRITSYTSQGLYWALVKSRPPTAV